MLVLELLLLHKGASIMVGLIGTMVFLVVIAPLSVVHLPWLGLIVGQAYLLSKKPAVSLSDIIKAKFQATAV